MELTNEFTVEAPVEQAWAVLTDLERIAPCMPGAQLTEIEGDEYRGSVRVKVGPISAQYKGVAQFVSKDDATHVAVLKAQGRDTRGQGNASANITARLEPVGAATKVSVVTDLNVTGKVAQMGRGVLADVSAKLLDQFVASLERDVLAEGSKPAGGNGSAPEPVADVPQATADAPPMTDSATTGPRKIDSPTPPPVDLLGTAGAPVVKRIGPIIGVLVVVLWLMRRRRKRRK